MTASIDKSCILTALISLNMLLQPSGEAAKRCVGELFYLIILCLMRRHNEQILYLLLSLYQTQQIK